MAFYRPLAAATIAAALTLTPVAAFATTAPSVLRAVVTPESRELVADTNALRVTLGLEPLQQSAELDAVAQAWADKMASGAVPYSHNPNLTSEVPQGWVLLGENVAYRSAPSVSALFQQWVNSPGHYANLTGDFTDTGMAVAIGANGWMYGVQVFGNYPFHDLTPEPDPTPSETPAATPEPTPSETSTPAPDPSETPTPDVTPTPDPSETPDPGVTPTPDPSDTQDPSETPTPGVSEAPTPDPGVTPTPDPSDTPTADGTTQVAGDDTATQDEPTASDPAAPAPVKAHRGSHMASVVHQTAVPSRAHDEVTSPNASADEVTPPNASADEATPPKASADKVTPPKPAKALVVHKTMQDPLVAGILWALGALAAACAVAVGVGAALSQSFRTRLSKLFRRA